MTPNQQQSPIQSVGATETVREQDKIMLVLSYLGILALIPLLTVKDSDYVKWHAKQGLVFGLGGGFALAILALIPFIGWIIGCLGFVGYWVVNVMGMMKAIKGERWQIPVVSDIAAKL